MGSRKNPEGGIEAAHRALSITPAGFLALAGFVILLACSGCSRSADVSGPADLRPLDSDVATTSEQGSTHNRSGPDANGAPPTGDSHRSSSPADPSVGSSGSGSPAGPTYGVGGTMTDNPADVEAVRALLVRYDDLVTRLAVAPARSADRSSPIRAEWAKLVPVESALSSDVLNHLVAGPLAAGTRLLPGPGGVSFRHHVERTGRRDDDSIEFTWCGYSPGIRVDAASGAVLDDQVAHLRGIGRADRDPTDPTRWMLDSFDQLDMVVLPAGSTDPCPGAGVAGAGERGAGERGAGASGQSGGRR